MTVCFTLVSSHRSLKPTLPIESVTALSNTNAHAISSEQKSPTSPHFSHLLSSLCSNTPTNHWCYVNQGIGAQQNFPSYPYSRPTATYKRSPVDRLQKVVLFGGKTTGSADIQQENTWLYTPWTNSWEALSLDPSPKGRHSHLMTTLCEMKVLLHGGIESAENKSTTLNDTWIFDGSTETWTPIRYSAKSDPALERSNYAAAAFYQPKTKCSCKESLVVVGGTGRVHPTSLYELRCINERKNIYKWIRKRGNPNATGNRLDGAQGFSMQINSTSYFIINGGTDKIGEGYENGKHYYYSRSSSYVWLIDLDTNQWVQLIDYSSDNFSYFRATASRSFVFSSKNVFLVFGDEKVFAFDMENNIWMKVGCLFCAPPGPIMAGTYRRGYAKIGDTILSFGVSDAVQDIWYNAIVMNVTINFIDRSNNLIIIGWLANPPPLLSPPLLFPGSYSSATSNNSMFLFGGFLNKNLVRVGNSYLIYPDGDYMSTDSVWQLNYQKMVWHQMKPNISPGPRASHCGALASNKIFVQFGGSSLWFNFGEAIFRAPRNNIAMLEQMLRKDLWGFDIEKRLWIRYVSLGTQPQFRLLCSMTSMQNGSVLLFGGLVITHRYSLRPTNDLWLLTLNKRNVATWKKLSKRCANVGECWRPQPRFHAVLAAIDNSRILLFGGYVRSEATCSDNVLWIFDMKKMLWTPKNVTGDDSTSYLPPRSKTKTQCFSAGTLIGNKFVVSLIYTQSADPRQPEKKSRAFLLDTSTWKTSSIRRIALGSVSEGVLQSALHNYHDAVISLGTFSTAEPEDVDVNFPPLLLLPHPGCPAGEYSMFFRKNPCRSCDVATYASAGSNQCEHCPVGSTTLYSNAESLQNCTCSTNYCVHGSCFLTYQGDERIKPKVTCQCNAGFTGATCQFPTYYLLGAGVIIASSMLTLMLVFAYKHQKRNENRKRLLKDMRKTFNIPEEEIELEERIDTTCRGGYSKVHKAKYRGMSYVAIKELLMDIAELDKRVLLEFAREIEIMTLLSHKNVVRFFGAGKFAASKGPFLVIEFAERGSLKNILLSSAPVSMERKLRFALDAARGMEYLHGQSPPRIHRDLKTANLLVDQNWVVKVADFGCARMAQKEGKETRPKKRNHTSHRSEIEMKLFHSEVEEMTVWHIGTLYWTSPEVLLKKAYGSSADVYRYINILCLIHLYVTVPLLALESSCGKY